MDTTTEGIANVAVHSYNSVKEKIIERYLFVCALISIFVTISIVLVLLSETVSFFRDVSIIEFLTGTRWAPTYTPSHFGVLPLINGTLLIAIGSSIIALPVGLTSAIYLSEYANERTRGIVKPVIELLAGIPTVVYGCFAVLFVTPIIRKLIPETEIFNAASACIVVGIMILPMVSSLSEDAIRSVPHTLREGAYALGATKYEVTTRVVLPSALSGILASFILAISRAIGETMAVTLAAGATPNITLNIFESIQTMTAYIVQVSLGDTPAGSIAYKSIFAIGMVLFLMTFGMNLVSQWIRSRYREVYE
ncbi:MAG: Binding-protein-dependent transport system innermembrane component [Candidatus Argoarchaeum ethanivorans]|uniref:Phosphate transport system permease protein n=1 Tax=Candidatus Argoarchaeum ethanivorans TaxID=2608793 RepID=A0A811T9X4_9EURY|nr:MAG: Binding-protein-dependent transport system innermembrane component [Candidatus Argoarchaeum ethanivorans]CAD6490792.1 MAG: Binding-protein-dependent transport system innermembrane component [Candidatus Argoarchaeum ethanivorans]CAD6491595.1 MAG: Binding-protein-dependent transport system innermembrane component [Candidatus Argoarchaeum ethanivorans]CAD6492506.1 MAG: Binding-protein-dependent transport system innermembrane component [Candidatus Argoarchaeum ethanivorans]